MEGALRGLYGMLRACGGLTVRRRLTACPTRGRGRSQIGRLVLKFVMRILRFCFQRIVEWGLDWGTQIRGGFRDLRPGGGG